MAGFERGVRPDGRLVDVDHLVDERQAFDAFVLGGVKARAVKAPRGGVVQGLDDQGRLAAARDAGDANQGPEREVHVDVGEVVPARADHRELLVRVPGPAAVRHLDLAKAGKVLAGDAARIRHDFGGLAFGNHLAAVDARAGPHVDNVIRAQDRVLVVLDDDDRIAEVAQPLEGFEQAVVVALVQPDGRLVEDVENPGQPRADLRGEPDALAFAAGKGRRGPRKREILEPHVP